MKVYDCEGDENFESNLNELHIRRYTRKIIVNSLLSFICINRIEMSCAAIHTQYGFYKFYNVD